jgi:cytochrome bd-type quinol oxidase subunit 2
MTADIERTSGAVKTSERISERTKIVRDGAIALGVFTGIAGGTTMANSAGGVLESTSSTTAAVVLAVVFSVVVAFNLAVLRHLRSHYVTSRVRGRRHR